MFAEWSAGQKFVVCHGSWTWKLGNQWYLQSSVARTKQSFNARQGLLPQTQAKTERRQQLPCCPAPTAWAIPAHVLPGMRARSLPVPGKGTSQWCAHPSAIHWEYELNNKIFLKFSCLKHCAAHTETTSMYPMVLKLGSYSDLIVLIILKKHWE